MRKDTFFAHKKPAQAMVEFAIALPILLLMLYGILEAGRLLFLYSTVVTASRQAVRYGAATGENDNGTPRYQDCAGIRNAANMVGYLGKFQAITLSYDTGPNTQVKPLCPDPTQLTDSNLTTRQLEGNRTRLVVTVKQKFQPIVPKLVPFIARDITASSARTILYSVPIVVEQEQQEWYKAPTITEITMVDPEPSEINQWVTVSVRVTGGDTPPTGIVDITGADTNCSITLNGSGEGSCQVLFTSAGTKTITAYYKGDTDHLASSVDVQHEVTLYHTTTTILSDLPDPSTKDQYFVVIVKVDGGQTTPGGTVVVDGGGNVNCTIVLLNGAGSCALSFNTLGAKTLTATYSGDSLHLPSSDTEGHSVLIGTPTPTLTPTITPIPPTPTATLPPTATITPTPIPSPVPLCNAITAPGGITISGNIMSVTISNPYPFTLVLKDITVTWNDDKGHLTGGNKKLKLQKVTVGGTTVFAGNVTNQSTVTIITTATMGPGNTTVSFYFDQTYDNRDGTENVIINWTTPGCENNSLNIK